jgi:hypothetical protein
MNWREIRRRVNGYRLITGEDDEFFRARVNACLAEGYELYGSPSITADRNVVYVAQALVLPEQE